VPQSSNGGCTADTQLIDWQSRRTVGGWLRQQPGRRQARAVVSCLRRLHFGTRTTPINLPTALISVISHLSTALPLFGKKKEKDSFSVVWNLVSVLLWLYRCIMSMCILQAGEKMGNENGADGSEVSQHLEPITTCNSSSNSSSTTETYPMTPMVCCPHHHSCMLSPVSPVGRSCQVMHPANCYQPPLIYSSPVIYGNSGRRSSNRLQRWNSMDANIGNGPQVWNNETWPAPRSSLDESYGSETTPFPPHRMERSMRQAYSCQPLSHGMYSPFCRSFEYNLWGQVQNNAVDPLQTSDPSNPHSSLSINVNLSENPTNSDQVQPQSKQ